jgi:HK97 gp10 family phage protein
VLNSERDLLRLGYRVQSEARKLCPVDTGRLRASIDVKSGRDARGPYVEVGTNVDYGPFVEYGTSKSAAQPYMRPALLIAARSWGQR